MDFLCSGRVAAPPTLLACMPGVLAPGYRADLNVIDFDRLVCVSPNCCTTFLQAARGGATGHPHLRRRRRDR